METRKVEHSRIKAMENIRKILVIQTAFIGDVILTLPMIQKIKRHINSATIDFIATPRAGEILKNHPSITELIAYDKHGKDKGIIKLLRLVQRLRVKKYDVVIVPHRSIRSAFLAWLLKPEKIIGFDTSAGHWLFTDVVKYSFNSHEIERNLSLLEPLGLKETDFELPVLYPAKSDKSAIDSVIWSYDITNTTNMIAVAPGTVWNTKRWSEERFAQVCKQMSLKGYIVWLIGGREDKQLCEKIKALSEEDNVINTAGNFSLMQSAELIKRCRLLICNDSAPMHIAVAVGTPVIAIFGATIPEFGFAPRGKRDIVIEKKGLKCRPCSIHGGKKCPIKTFECMLSITPDQVLQSADLILKG